MNDGWIKLYRKLRGHEILHDPTALQIFIWILICVDYKTGKMTSGRFWGAEELGINPNTFYKALRERVCQRHKLVTLTSNNKNTTISVNNWAKYQHDSNTSGNNKVTTKEQQSNTKQEVKEIKEIKNNNNIRERGTLTQKDFEEISSKYQVPISFVLSKYEDVCNWEDEKPGRMNGRNWRLTLIRWVKDDAIKIKRRSYGDPSKRGIDATNL